MAGRWLRPLPAALFGATVAVESAAVVLTWGLAPAYDTLGYSSYATVGYAVYAVVMSGVGALVASRVPGNAIGWLFCGFALLNAVASDLAQGYGLRAVAEGWPGGVAGQWISLNSWLPSGLGWLLTFLLFPDGRLPGRRWRVLPWLGAAGMVLGMTGWALGDTLADSLVGGRNPTAVAAAPTGVLLTVGMTLFVGSLLASIGSLVGRLRRASGPLRQQLRWFVFAAAVAGILLPASFLLWSVTPVAGVLAVVALTGLALAVGVGVLRYRLYDLDMVISATITYGVLTVLLAGVYAATAVVLGTAFGGGSAWVTAAATLVAALAFRPLRTRLQDVVNRRFNRARYHALHRMAGFLDALRSDQAAPEDVRAVLRETLGDPDLELLVFLPESRLYVDLDGTARADTTVDGRVRILIERGGQPLGVVHHDPAPDGNPVLARKIVEAGGLAIEITRLRVELRRQLAEVRASRARIVAAADAERTRLERDLHDGAQQRLVSIGLALRHAQHQLTSGASDRVSDTLDGAVVQVAEAIQELRALAHGLPPAQLDAGLAPAFQDLARRAPLPVEVRVPTGRFGQNLEAAAYFVGSEGLTNAIKHARATRVTLTARHDDAALVVTVTDDGVGGAAPRPGGGLAGLADRVAVFGGTLRIDSAPAAGTTLTAELPCGS